MEKTKVPPCMESGIHFFIPIAGVSLLRHKDIKPGLSVQTPVFSAICGWAFFLPLTVLVRVFKGV